jgi:hypothetical protein
VHHLDIRGQEAWHALLPEAAVERAHGVGMGVGFLGALLSRAIGEQHQGTDDLVPSLRLIDKTQLQLRELRGRLHRHPFHRL